LSAGDELVVGQGSGTDGAVDEVRDQALELEAAVETLSEAGEMAPSDGRHSFSTTARPLRLAAVGRAERRLAEGGAVAATGLTRMAERLALVAEPEDRRVPPSARPVPSLRVEPLRTVDDKVMAPERQRLAWQRTREVSRRLVTLPAVGPITATALVATVGDPALFRLARAHAPSAFDRRPGMAGRDQQAWRGPSPPARAATRLWRHPRHGQQDRSAGRGGAGPRPTLPSRHGRRKRRAAGAGEPAT
jgi:hypothetical protein